MALATYADLVSAGANWTGRGDLTSRIPEFIVLAEAKMNRKLRTKDMETKNATFGIDAEYVSLPTGFGGVREFYLNTSPKRVLSVMPGDSQTSAFGTGNGIPAYYEVVGSTFRFGPVPTSTGNPVSPAFTATLIYYLTIPALTGSNTTNWLMTSHPDAYLYGIMAETAGFLTDWEDQQAWEAKMYKVLDEVVGIANKDKWGGNSMTVRIG
jgi:hypothetical protein